MKAKMILLALAMLIVAPFAANALSTFDEDTVALPNDTNVTVNLSKFTGNLTDLTAIHVELELRLTNVQVQLDNDSTSSQVGTARIINTLKSEGGFSSSVTLLKSDFDTINGGDLGINTSQVFNLDPTSGDTVGQFNATGSSDYANWSVSETTAGDSGNIASIVWEDYVGSGDFTITVNTTYVTSATFAGELGFFEGNTPTGELYANVTYEYVPEPATLALLGFGGLLIRKRRRS